MVKEQKSPIDAAVVRCRWFHGLCVYASNFLVTLRRLVKAAIIAMSSTQR
jgi:hypothetical protein